MAANKKITESEIKSLLDGYFKVHESLYEYLPPGGHIRYISKNAKGQHSPYTERFHLGGFLKTHYTNPDGKHFLQLETRLRGVDSQITPGYAQINVAYADIDELWKKYDAGAFIEIQLINASLKDKKRQLAEQKIRLDKMQSEIDELRAELKASRRSKSVR